MIIDRDKHNKYVVGWKPNYTVPTNQGSSSGTNVTIVYGGGGSGSSTPVSSEAFSYYKVSDGENAITQEAKVLKDIANLSIIGDEGIKVELITDPTIFEASFTSTGTNKGVYKISYGKVTTVVEKPETLAEEPTEPEVVITFPMTITYVSGEKIKAELFDTLRLLNNTEEVATYPSSGLTIEGDADGILSISLEVYKEVLSVDEEGKPVQDAEGNPVMEKLGLYFNRILLTTLLEDQPSTQAEGDSTEEEPQQPTYESLLSFDVVVNIDTVIKLSVTAVSDLWKLDDNGNIYTEYNAYSLKELSAYGLGEGGAGDIAGYLYELGDVNIPDPNAIPDNAILQYNIETGKWEAVELELPEDSATREWVELKFKDLINGAPADLDTLGEIAIAIQELQQLLDWFSFVDGRIRANYNFWGVGEVSAYGPASGSDPGTGGGAGYLHELGDVTINNDTLANGLIIVWDEDSQMWVNTDFPGLDEDALALYLTQNKYATLEWVNGLLDPINNKLEEFQTTIDMINDMFEWDNGKIKAKATLYSVGEISAYGAGEGSSGTGGYLHELDDVLLTSLLDDQLLMYDATIEKWVNVDKDEVGLNETKLALYLTEHNYAIMSNVVPITRRVIAGDGLQGGGPLSADVTLSMAPLTASDIPGLDWSKIISGKPTTLAGYGITDGVNAVSVTGTGNAVTTASISGHTLTLTKALSFALITGTNATGIWPISITGNAATASKWATARTITLAGSVTGSTSIDGSGNVTITTTYTTNNISALDGRYVNVTGDTMTGNLTLPTLQANTSIILGSVKLEYDSVNNALKISNVNTQLVINLYATGEISAYGYNSGSAGGGASALNDLDDVTLSNLLNGQALVYNSSTGQWVNTTILAGGIDETALAQYLTNNQYLTMPTGDARYVTLGTTQTISGAKTFSNHIFIRGSESNDISTVFNASGSITVNSTNSLSAIVHALSFKWYDSYWQIGNIRSGSVESDGFGITKDNSNLVFRVNETNGWLNGYPILTSNNYTSYIGNSFVKKAGDTMTGTLTLYTSGTTSYNQGIRINRTALDQWATLTIGCVGTATAGTSANTWLIGTPSSSNSLIFNLNNASESAGLCLKGHGNTDMKWNNQTVWHAGNDGSGSGLDADLLDGIDSSRFFLSNAGSIQESTLSTYTNRRSGSYYIPLVGYSRSLITFQGTGSSSGIDLLVDYQKRLWCRWHIDSNRYNGDFREFAFTDSNVASATQLQTARTINGTAFNGTSNIVTSYWGTARTLSLTGNATGSVSMNGSSNVSMSVNVNYATSAGNADTLDGYHGSNYLRSFWAEYDANTYPTNSFCTFTYARNAPYFGVLAYLGINGYGMYLNLAYGTGTSTGMIAYRKVSPSIDGGGLGAWAYLARTTDNVASASKLQTSQTIWGRPFDGTAPVSGSMTGVGSISMSGALENRAGAVELYGATPYIDFHYNNSSADYTSRLIANRSNNLNCTSSFTADGNITAASFYTGNWFRSTGQTGWYSETYGGGWYMTDTTWLRAYNGKSIYTSSVMQADGIMRAGGGFETSSQDILRFTNYTHKNVIDWYWTSTEGDTVRFRIPGNNGQGIWMRLSAGNPYGLYISGALNVTNGIYSNTYVSALGQNSSDVRLKTNIQDFNATSLIKQLHPKSFEWNDLAKSKFEVFRNTGTQYGLIAQDVKEVMPEWVDDNLIGSGYMGIRYDKLIPILLQGEIETISRVETLEDKVKRLETENSKLKAKLSKLERRIR